MEIYYQNSDAINISIFINGSLADPDSNTVNVEVIRLADNTTIANTAANRVSTGKYSLTLTSANNSTLGQYQATWTYQVNAIDVTKTNYYDVIVGFTSAQEVRDDFPELSSKTNDEIYRKEKLARKIIKNFCGQNFDFENDVQKKIWGKGNNHLLLPKRITTLTNISYSDVLNIYDDITSTVEIESDYYLRPISEIGVLDIKRDITIIQPFFIKDNPYYVTGDWGWVSVPDDIQTATKYLISDYFDDDSLLRQHGIWNAQFGDTSVEMISRKDSVSQLWGTTGNYDVDILLSSYVLTNFTLL